MYRRSLDLTALLGHHSLFLFGPRQTGKTTLLRQDFPTARYYDLFEANTFRELSAHPELIRQRLQPSDRIVVIDEIHQLPLLLNEVQVMMERASGQQLRFIPICLAGTDRAKVAAFRPNRGD